MQTQSPLTLPNYESSIINNQSRILLFDSSVGGHHAAYIRHLISYWCNQNVPGRLDIVVVPKFLEEHQDIVEFAQVNGKERVNFTAISDSEVAWLGSTSSYLQRKLFALREWTLLNRYATALQSTQCLLLYFDTFQLSTVFKRKLPCPFSGIYFRPRFHYGDFSQCPLSWKDKVRHWQERFHISLALGHPQLKTLFCLDQFAVEYLNQFHRQPKAVYLPDPVENNTNIQFSIGEFRKELGIESHRQIFLLFGVLDARKGIYQLLEAISTLSPDLGQKMCLLIVGKIADNDKLFIKKQIQDISEKLPVQIILKDKFVAEHEVPLYFKSADVVLATYQRHVGMSGILLQAAAVQKPVLSSNYGLMGQIVNHWQLGLTVDSTVPSEIAVGLTKFLVSPSPKAELFNPDKAKIFAESNGIEKFTSTIFSYI
jgi:glycosyltransferase involved in cell wall biosynthesis